MTMTYTLEIHATLPLNVNPPLVGRLADLADASAKLSTTI